MPEVTMSSKNQIVVPREAREALRLKPGAKLQVMVHGDKLLVMRVLRNPARALAGSMQGTYPPGYLTLLEEALGQSDLRPILERELAMRRDQSG